ncbi:MAG: ROK family protein [Clostridia bacterium]|nr:ROK family protein [Clostridia bacterium]
MARIGIDIGGTFLKAGVVSDDGQVIATASRPTGAERPADAIMADIAAVAQDAADAAGLTMADIQTVGAGCPGTCNRQTGMVEYANNLHFVNVPLGERLRTLLKAPVYVENDANAAVLGEHIAGAAKGADDCACITLGTGVGGGVMVNGRLITGVNGSGGELGHMVICVDGEPCTCGRNGCWESYASVSALIRQTRAAMQAHPESALWRQAPALDRVDGRTPFDAMRQGDAVAAAVVERYLRYVAAGIINIINIFQPDILCIGGAISKEGDTLLDPIRRTVIQERYNRYSDRQTRLCVAELGNRAGLIGAAFLDRQAG